MNHVYTASKTFVQKKTKQLDQIFSFFFASITCILIGKDDEYEKKKTFHISDSVCKDLYSFPTSIFVSSHRQNFWGFLVKFHGHQNILLYEYLNMQYINIKNRSSTFKQTNKKNNFIQAFFFINTWIHKKSTFWAKSWENQIFNHNFDQILQLDHMQYYYQSKDAVDHFH